MKRKAHICCFLRKFAFRSIAQKVAFNLIYSRQFLLDSDKKRKRIKVVRSLSQLAKIDCYVKHRENQLNLFGKANYKMKISEVSISKDELLDVGLNEIRMKDLGRLVLLAGPNGAGKSRLLSMINVLFRNYLTSEQCINLEKKDQ